jgi:hypothetical protein
MWLGYDRLLAAKAEARASWAYSSNHFKQVQDDENNGNYDQNMDPTPCLGEA